MKWENPTNVGGEGKEENPKRKSFPLSLPRRVYSYQTKAEPKLNENMGIGCRHKNRLKGTFFRRQLQFDFRFFRREEVERQHFFVPVAYSYGSSKKYAFQNAPTKSNGGNPNSSLYIHPAHAWTAAAPDKIRLLRRVATQLHLFMHLGRKWGGRRREGGKRR